VSKPILAWHFLTADRKMRGTHEVVEPGYIYSQVGPLVICERGMHASVRAIDAIHYAPGPIVCRVRCSGKIIAESGKIVSRHREVLWMADASSVLRLIATECVRKTPLADGRTFWDLLTDPRSRNAVEVAERYAYGKATDQDLGAARDVAWGAARDAARDVAWGAARDAARDAAWDAARDAARGAARDAAWGAAWGAARGAQNKIATDLLMTLAPRGKR
jgi:hypothetical protein